MQTLYVKCKTASSQHQCYHLEQTSVVIYLTKNKIYTSFVICVFWFYSDSSAIFSLELCFSGAFYTLMMLIISSDILQCILVLLKVMKSPIYAKLMEWLYKYSRNEKVGMSLFHSFLSVLISYWIILFYAIIRFTFFFPDQLARLCTRCYLSATVGIRKIWWWCFLYLPIV